MANRSAIVGLVVLIVILAGLLYVSRQAPAIESSSGTMTNASDETAVQAAVAAFGAQLKNVSLLAPDAAQQIAADYAPYVAPELIQTWTASTTQAPGRLTSSPWPERIDVQSVNFPSPGEAVVEASVVAMTSASSSPASVQPVQLTLQDRNGTWLITSWQLQGPAQ